MRQSFCYDSPVGRLILVSDGDALTELRFGAEEGRFDCTEKRLPVIEEAVCWLDLYFAGRQPGFVPRLSPQGSPFRQAVWDILLGIPYGSTMSYGEIARRIESRTGSARMSAQAVGGAVGHNPIALIIPCHRVIGSDGSLTGYAGGLDRKKWLLDLERRTR